MSTTDPISSPQRPSSQRKLDDIMAAAREEFFENGFSATSIEAIAARAGVSKVTIYNHYGDKETLFRNVLHKQILHMKQNFAIANLDERSLREILTSAGLAMLDFLTQPRMVRFERMLAAEVNRDPKIGALFLNAGPHLLLESLAALLEASKAQGQIESDDIIRSAEMLPGLVIGRLDLLLRYGADIDLSDEAKSKRVKSAVDAWMLIHAPRSVG